jgi:hypothetical protein
MFLLLLCLGTILAPTCQASCQLSCSPPPLFGSVGAAWFHPFSRSTTAPTRSYAAAPAPSPTESGHGTRWLPSAASRLAWPLMPGLEAASPWQTAGFTPRRSCRNQVGLVFRPTGFFTFSSGAATRRSRNCFLPREKVFECPGPAVPS